jgi:hypothetical protein
VPATHKDYLAHRDFLKITVLYTVGIFVTFYLCWLLLEVAMPEAKLDLFTTLTTAFGVNLPNDMPLTMDTQARKFSVIGIITLLSLGLAILNVFFGAVITARFIRPRVRLATSSKGVLSTTWNAERPYILVRLSNFYAADLVDVRIGVVLMVEETRKTPEGVETFRSYLPLADYTPQFILVMERRMPWSLAVPADAHLSNSLTRDYHFRPGTPIATSFSKGKTILTAERKLQILIQGVDSQSYSDFVIHRTIPVDRQDGEAYTLHLHKGAFKSLPMQIKRTEELEQYV